jgi:magnesium chelatase family protein
MNHTFRIMGIASEVLDLSICKQRDANSPLQAEGLDPNSPGWRELRVRVGSAIQGLDIYVRTGGLFVRGLPCDGSSLVAYDLPVALELLHYSLPYKCGQRIAAVGELSLSGDVRPVSGIIPMVESARRCGVSVMLVPATNYKHALSVPGPMIVPVGTLHEANDFLRGDIAQEILQGRYHPITVPFSLPVVAMSDIRGMETQVAAVTKAAQERKSVLLIGPAGSGKTMLGRRYSTVMPPITDDERMDVARIYSVAGLLHPNHDIDTMQRPFRAPHHTCSTAAIAGGGRSPRAGEVTLAHNGVLFLDELPEFPKATLEAVVNAHEDKMIRISRSDRTTTFPSDFVLVASMNACPCGLRWGRFSHNCRCTSDQIERYWNRIDGIRDLFDVEVEMFGCNELHTDAVEGDD